jgi:O-antigen/teichoic acid export membrane protein
MKQDSTAVMSLTAYLISLRQTLRHPLASDVRLLTLSWYLAGGLGLLTNIVAARWLGPAAYGTAALAMAYPMLLWSFVDVKSASVTTRYIASFRAAGRNEELKSICKLGYGLDFLVSVATAMLVGGTGWWVARSVYNLPQISWLMMVYAASFPVSSLCSTSWAILTSWQKFRWLAVLSILDKLITLALVLGLLLAEFGALGLVMANAVGQVANGLIMMLAATYILRRDGLDFWWSTSLKEVAPLRKELGSLLGWNYVAVTLRGVMGQVPLILLGRLRGPEEASFYRLATSLTTVGSYLENVLERVTYPILSARWSAGARESLKSTLKHWTLRGGLPVGALMLLTIPLLPIFVPMVFGSGYSPMTLGVQVMMVGTALSAMFFWLSSSFYAFGRIALWTKAYGLYTVLFIVLAWFCIQWWGFPGLAGLTAVGKVGFILSMVLRLVAQRN